MTNADSTATFTPAAALSPNTTYSILVPSTVVDEAGNAITNPTTTTFTTGSASDLIRPSVIATDPASGAAGVATDAALALQSIQRVEGLTANSGTVHVI